MFTTSPDHLPHNKSLEIKQDDKFFSRLLSKENSVANPSFRVYYGGLPGAVPFMWESQPGTPKYTFSDTSIPPLTPPPSYYSNSNSNSKPIKNKHSRSGLFQALFPKIISLKKTSSLVPTSPPPSSSSPMFLAIRPGKYQKRSRFLTPDDEVDTAAIGSPTSTLCFDIGRGKYR
ncbi:hypothetical protein ERO13_A10G149200v2 [Gossypium hirsutum]|uniref:YLP motif-containing protein 1-like n=4 Tax=Gossypium TaxID=3633 RepID=A0A1U8IH57_GOSHI|nr:uncharacterized protein LOC107896757 [Gossypium hirsutum]KAG4180157.1 hypothetical protein ERO13_A10G149200v2 [Gossypium hirsutum]TYG99225.1 hypothetical protein ES288_A10G179400v1 [Gossypium darwinii]TYI06714.1 hypothetical protein ES332_A10G178400v1 [Gossypium tomentosum]TYJ15145.1 hypothetical protein E1A91_A10G165100v1 [Gossypium mustelinum]